MVKVVKKFYFKAAVCGLELERVSVRIYEIELVEGTKRCSVHMTPDGSLLRREQALDVKALPAAIQQQIAKRGKLPVRERIALALDPDSPFLEISGLAAWDSDFKIGGGCVVGIGVIAGVECVLFAFDPSVLGGALTPYVQKKWMRAIEIAR